MAERLREHPASTAASGSTQEQHWAQLERSLLAPLAALPPGVGPELVVAAHQWSLSSPLFLREPEDFQALRLLTFKPLPHQLRAALAFFRRLCPRGLIADDVGLGKTVVAGLIVLELVLRRRIQGYAIIAPRLLQEQWRRELRDKFRLDARIVAGKDLEQLPQSSGIITTYQHAAEHLPALEAAGIDLLVLDEVHKLTDLRSAKQPTLAKALLVAQQSHAFRYCLGLTATPAQHSLRDLFALAELFCAPGPTPYGSLRQLEARFLADPAGHTLKPGMEDDFRRRTREVMYRTSRPDPALVFPAREVRVELLRPTLEEEQLLAVAFREIFGGKSGPQQRIRLAQTLLSSPAAVVAAIDRKTGEPPATELFPLRARFVALQETAKSKGLLELLRTLQKQAPHGSVVVFTGERATAELVAGAIERSTLKGRVRVTTDADGDADAERLDLTACQAVIHFNQPWNPIVAEQRLGRVQRLGQTEPTLVVHHLVTQGTIDETVVSRLFEALRLDGAPPGFQTQLFGRLADDEEGFEKVVLELVREAVVHGDAQPSINRRERAAALALEELGRQRLEIERAVGALDLELGGPAVPEAPVVAALDGRGRLLRRGEDGPGRASDPGRR